jgi:hypothetical protein
LESKHSGNDFCGQTAIILKILGEFLLFLIKEMSGPEEINKVFETVSGRYVAPR